MDLSVLASTILQPDNTGLSGVIHCCIKLTDSRPPLDKHATRGEQKTNGFITYQLLSVSK